MRTSRVFIGIDVGTQGARAMAFSHEGALLASHTRTFTFEHYRMEQDVAVWWSAVVSCLQGCARDLRLQQRVQHIYALLVTSTSGTVIPLDRRHEPLGPALMYSDTRPAAEAERCKAVAMAAAGSAAAYRRFNSSSSLPKILWFMRHAPRAAADIALWAHPADYISGKLSGVWGITDTSSALKTGCDMESGRWPDYISAELGVPAEWLPQVVPTGTPLGPLAASVAELTGLPSGTLVCAGVTDGCASQIASGAVRPGDWNSTIGTTLVVKGVHDQPIVDPRGRLYNHKHPDGYWMPGGASNTGSDWVAGVCAGSDPKQLSEAAAELVPTSLLAYPLLTAGERFPFLNPEARGFEPPGLDPAHRFAASMEGVAYIERLSYETISRLSGEKIQGVYAAGGASGNELWLQIRSCVLRLPIVRMKHKEGAAGAAILAAAKTMYGSLREAAEAMNDVALRVEPVSTEWVRRYDEDYRRFVETLAAKGYFTDEETEVTR